VNHHAVIVTRVIKGIAFCELIWWRIVYIYTVISQNYKGTKMRVKLLIIIAIIAFSFSACTKKVDSKEQTTINPNSHKVHVQEVIQVSGYTYLRVKEGDKESWIATTPKDVKSGDVVYFLNGMEMKNFESKELKRKYDLILFVDDVSSQPIAVPAPPPTQNGMGMMSSGNQAKPQKPVIEKQNISIKPATGGVTIAQLYSKSNSYSEKNVIIKGQVVKVNNGIMQKNWVHIQDGTSSGNYYDLTVTTSEKVNVGDVVTFQGKIELNQDFGYGYAYPVLLTDARRK